MEQRTSDVGISKERRDEVRFVFNPLSGSIIAHSLPDFIECRSKDRIRAIQKLSIIPIVQYYCVTGSADGDVRVWVHLSSSVLILRLFGV